jgi:hypothetical protein
MSVGLDLKCISNEQILISEDWGYLEVLHPGNMQIVFSKEFDVFEGIRMSKLIPNSNNEYALCTFRGVFIVQMIMIEKFVSDIIYSDEVYMEDTLIFGIIAKDQFTIFAVTFESRFIIVIDRKQKTST